MYLLLYLYGCLVSVFVCCLFASLSLSLFRGVSLDSRAVSLSRPLSPSAPALRDKAAANKSDLKWLDVVHVHTRFALVYLRPHSLLVPTMIRALQVLDAVESCFRSRCVARFSQAYGKVEAHILSRVYLHLASPLLFTDVEIYMCRDAYNLWPAVIT